MNITLQQSMIEEAIRAYLLNKGLSFTDENVTMTFRTGRRNKTGTVVDVTIDKLGDKLPAASPGTLYRSGDMDVAKCYAASNPDPIVYDAQPESTAPWDEPEIPDAESEPAQASLTPTESFFDD